MTRKCFFVPEVGADTTHLELSPRLSRQLETVLRAKAGESLEVLDANGLAWECVITAIRRGRATVTVLGRLERPACEAPLFLTLGLGIARPDTMDLIIRQATEMGVSRLALFRAARSQYTLSGKPAENKKERWARIAGEAVCQCGRRIVPEIVFFDDLVNFLVSLETDPQGRYRKIFASEPGLCTNSKSLSARTTGLIKGPIAAVLGPEGGWHSSESSALISAGFEPISLGPRTLRMETAAVALISSIQLLWGDMGEGRSGQSTDSP